MILVFKSDEARKFFESRLKGSAFEKVTKDMALHAARIGINGKIVPYGYTTRLTQEEKAKLSTANWDETARLLAEGNERLYKEAMESYQKKNDEKNRTSSRRNRQRAVRFLF